MHGGDCSSIENLFFFLSSSENDVAESLLNSFRGLPNTTTPSFFGVFVVDFGGGDWTTFVIKVELLVVTAFFLYVESGGDFVFVLFGSDVRINFLTFLDLDDGVPGCNGGLPPNAIFFDDDISLFPCDDDDDDDDAAGGGGGGGVEIIVTLSRWTFMGSSRICFVCNDD